MKANISGIDSTISTIEGEITALQGEVTANTADIILANEAIIANGVITGANTIAITGNLIAIAGCLKNTQVQSGNIGLFFNGSILSVVGNPNHFVDVSILATNREFNLAPKYANLPTTKNNNITWNAPLNYDAGTDTASINLSSYLTSTQTSNTFVSSNSFFNNIIQVFYG
jgi:hypothetical protein